MAGTQCTREDPRRTTKAALKQHAKELRVLARTLKHDRKLQDMVEHAAELCEDARDSIKLKRAPARKREPAYTGGGTWHPPGMMPGGRRMPNRTPESW